MPEVKSGQRWRIVEPLDIGGIVMWRAPFTSGFRCRISTGTVVIVDNDPAPTASAVYCLPEDYGTVEAVVVSEADRGSEKYGGYALVVPLNRFGRSLILES